MRTPCSPCSLFLPSERRKTTTRWPSQTSLLEHLHPRFWVVKALAAYCRTSLLTLVAGIRTRFLSHLGRSFFVGGSPTLQVDAFRVDGIPHLAMVNANGEVETAIIGNVPKEVSMCRRTAHFYG